MEKQNQVPASEKPEKQSTAKNVNIIKAYGHSIVNVNAAANSDVRNQSSSQAGHSDSRATWWKVLKGLVGNTFTAIWNFLS